MTPRWHDITRQGLAVAALLVALVSGGRTEEQVRGGTARVMVSDAGLPGIDRGLREQDPPIEPYGRRSRQMSRGLREASGRHGGAYLRGSVIVKFRSSTAQEGRNAARRIAGATDVERPSFADFELLEISMDADAEAVAADLSALPEVEYAQPRYRNYPMFRPNDPFYDRQWNFPLIDMERAWDIQPAAGSEVTVAVLDTGVAFRTATLQFNARNSQCFPPGFRGLPPLGNVIVPFAVAPELGDSKFVAPRDFIWDDDLPFDLDGHGTHVSGTIGQLTDNNTGVAGMAFNVKIMPVKVIDEVWDCVFDSPFVGTDDTLARGIRYAADNGAKVINMSIGRTAGGPAPAIEDAVRYAVSRGVFVAVAAGNSADQGNEPSRTAEAAPTIDGMVAVAAVSRDRERAYYSTTNTYVEVAAPGGDQRQHGTTGGVLQQTLDQDLLHTFFNAYRAPRADAFTYNYFQGTSMATPHVAGFAALLIQQGITSPAAIEGAMKQFATDLGRPGVDSDYGAGLINPRETLRGLGVAR